MTFVKNKLQLNKFLLLVVLLVSVFLHFYKSPELFVFTADEEHQLTIAQTIVDNFHLEWVGVSSADTGFYLGPLWMYFGAFGLWIGGGNLWWVSLAASAIGVATGLLIYFIGKTLFNKQVALISFLLYSTLPLIVYYDRKFWNPTLNSITSL